MTQVKSPRIRYSGAPGIDIAEARQSTPFREWLQKVDRANFVLRKVHFQSVDHKPSGAVLFVKFVCDCKRPDGNEINSITLARGGAVAILLVLNCAGKKYVVLTRQARLATGQYLFTEVPAGMLDGSGDFAGVAALELEEELGIVINSSELTDLTKLAGQQDGFFLSPGVCEETVRIFYKEMDVTQAEMAEMEGRIAGVKKENEVIVLAIEPLEQLWRHNDAKTMLSYLLYEKLVL